MKKQLSLLELIWIGTGHVVGAGVVTIVGSALAVTGNSTWLAFAVACFISFFRILPPMFFTSAVVAPGGRYGIITRCAGIKYGGLITISSLLSWAARGTAVLALSKYITDILPFANAKYITIAIWAIFTTANLYGIDMMSKIQSKITPLLLSSLLVFSIVCIINIKPDYLNFSSNDMFIGGVGGFFTAVVLLSYSCDGIASMANYSTSAKNPTKNIPLSMFCIFLITTTLYIIVGFACGAVLPLNQISGKTMTVTAKYILSPGLYYAFLIFGPIFALITTMNAGILDSAIPVMAGVEEGWLPSFLAKKNKYGAYYIAIIIIFIIGCMPVLFNLSVAEIASFTMVLSCVGIVLELIAAIKFPIIYKSEWQKSSLYLPNYIYYFLILLFCIVELFTIIQSLKNLSIGLIILNLTLVVIAAIYGTWRMNTTNIHIQN